METGRGSTPQPAAGLANFVKSKCDPLCGPHWRVQPSRKSSHQGAGHLHRAFIWPLAVSCTRMNEAFVACEVWMPRPSPHGRRDHVFYVHFMFVSIDSMCCVEYGWLSASALLHYKRLAVSPRSSPKVFFCLSLVSTAPIKRLNRETTAASINEALTTVFYTQKNGRCSLISLMQHHQPLICCFEQSEKILERTTAVNW